MPGVRSGLVAVFLIGFVGAAHAVCPGLDVLIEDGFDQLKPTWGDAGRQLKVEAGHLILSPESGTDFWRQNNAAFYDDIDFCVTVTVLDGVDETEARAGAVFWYQDVNNFYVFQIAPNRRASVWRRQRGAWLEQVAWQRVESANEGDGGVNELRVTTVGEQAVFYVNGSQFKALDGMPPERGQQIGVFASSPVAGRAIFAFDALRVTTP